MEKKLAVLLACTIVASCGIDGPTYVVPGTPVDEEVVTEEPGCEARFGLFALHTEYIDGDCDGESDSFIGVREGNHIFIAPGTACGDSVSQWETWSASHDAVSTRWIHRGPEDSWERWYTVRVYRDGSFCRERHLVSYHEDE